LESRLTGPGRIKKATLRARLVTFCRRDAGVFGKACGNLASMLKPLLTAFLLPPLAPLLIGLAGLLMLRWRRGLGALCITASLVSLTLLSSYGVAAWLSRAVLPQYAATSPAALKAQNVQAIAVLGGGVLPFAPEYAGEPQLSAYGAQRLAYGVWLAKQTGLPLAFSGGLGHAAHREQLQPEAAIAARDASSRYGVALRWVEGQSRDTAENARLLTPLLRRDGITRVALVTHAWHMPRAVAAFAGSGIDVVPAPTAFALPEDTALLHWLPSGQGLQLSRQVLREWLGLQVAGLSANVAR
jgi:uncharacterized SAM-binding protein YcdF (DUF218 family)